MAKPSEEAWPAHAGELDWIVMKVLDKDRNRCYETAGAFAADVERLQHPHVAQIYEVSERDGAVL